LAVSKLKNVFYKNVRLKILETVPAILKDVEIFIQGIPEDIKSDDIICVLWCISRPWFLLMSKEASVFIKIFDRIAGIFIL